MVLADLRLSVNKQTNIVADEVVLDDIISTSNKGNTLSINKKPLTASKLSEKNVNSKLEQVVLQLLEPYIEEVSVLKQSNHQLETKLEHTNKQLLAEKEQSRIEINTLKSIVFQLQSEFDKNKNQK